MGSVDRPRRWRWGATHGRNGMLGLDVEDARQVGAREAMRVLNALTMRRTGARVRRQRLGRVVAIPTSLQTTERAIDVQLVQS